MGGIGSGGHNRLSDEEKKRRGTFRPNQSEAVYGSRAAEKVITGIFLSKAPVPAIALGDLGRAEYEKLTNELIAQNKLTEFTARQANLAAKLTEEISMLAEQGKVVATSRYTALARALSNLNIAENATNIAPQGEKKSKYAGVGFASRRTA